MGKLCCSVTCAILGLISIICGFLVVFLFDSMLDNMIQKKLILKEGTDFYKNWANPTKFYRRVYFFNVTNVDQYLRKKEKPNLDELGPYTYRVEWAKTDVTFEKFDKISHKTVKHYFFDRILSVGPESDLIHTVNIPVLTASYSALASKDTRFTVGVSNTVQKFSENAFTKKNVSDLLWGYKDNLQIQRPNLDPDPLKLIGYFVKANGTVSRLYNVNSGEDDFQKFNTINWRNHWREVYNRRQNYWKNDKSCNLMNGTDGSSFPARVNIKTRLNIFNENLCRSLPLIYDEDVEQEGIYGYRFTPPADVFAAKEDNKENVCFCMSSPCSHGRGLSDITGCSYETPAFISWPHFYQADPKFRDAVTGLKPEKSKHQFYMDISPLTGIPFEARTRVQINYQTIGLKDMVAVQNVSDIILPVLWYEDSLTDIPSEIAELLRSYSYTPQVAKLSMLVVFFIVGVFLLLLSIVLIMKQMCGKSKTQISQKSSMHMNAMASPQYPEQGSKNGFRRIESDDTPR